MAKIAKRTCVNSPDSFCFICGSFTTSTQRRVISENVKMLYESYFGFTIGHQDKEWAPHRCCVTCIANLSNWMNGKRSSMPFAVPMIWREPTSHDMDCYFCLTNVVGFSRKNKGNIVYPNTSSATRPLPHSEELPIPVPPVAMEIVSEASLDTASSFVPSYEDRSSEPHLIEQPELNDLVRDLNLSKQHAELLGSRLQQWNLLAKDTKISVFRDRNKHLSTFFRAENKLCYCIDPDGLMVSLGIKHEVNEWRLFVDSSKSSLKAVLLHNGNTKPSVPVAYAIDMKETYESMALILKSINYDRFKWQLCGDLKVIGLLLGLQGGFTKYCCFLCLWDSRATQKHYVIKEWPERQSFVPGKENVKSIPLVDPKDVLLPPLHIKLGLVKNFVKALDKEGPAFQYLKTIFPKLSDAKLKEGIFVGPQIRKLMKDTDFEKTLNDNELNAWNSLKCIIKQFLGNIKSENYEQIVTDLLKNYQKMGCRMSLKIHFLHSHLDFFPQNLGAVSDEQGERFHQDILTMEQRYQGRWDPGMLGDHCWFLMRETDLDYKRKSPYAKKKST
ncbi:hypothetical protein PYW08_013286 [Mythimna loreyi]|uniref:Uncharacterized protein n=1 Tax=Mythimna loreyi TaxID=667449 RepID=A0ACC2QFB2_9NEOP|nr:hypothetical protein PYW08_013286 [Mythimna loreyi]